jgi:spoIIIJ-associated protein
MSEEEDRVESPADDGRQTEHAVEFLTGLVAAFGLDATVESLEVDEHYDEVRVSGADLGLLIGQRAATLDSVQELTRVVAQRRAGGRGESRLRVDVAGYRQRRREALERFARGLAEEVARTGVVKALEPMNSADRKVVHDVVGTMDGVSTLSEGEDPRRRVVIVPG